MVRRQTSETTRGGRALGLGMGAMAVAMAVAGAAGCDAEAPAAEDTLQVSCDGKCDGLDTIRNLMRDPSELSLADLVDVAAPKIFEELSDAVSTDAVGVELDAPTFHDAESIETLTTGLAARFGERELTTEVNRVRAQHLQESSDTTYAEVALQVDSSLSSRWSLAAEGLEDVASSLGFVAGAEVHGRFIGALDVADDDPLKHLTALRGFSVPRNVEDFRAMKPGELVALRGEGRLGLNLGAGVPLLIADPTAALSYSIVLTAGLRSQVSGVLDLQLVRLSGSQMVLDVGVEKAKVKSVRLALEDRWGVQGLLESTVEVAGIEVDLGKLVDRALQNELNDKLDLFSAHAERSSSETRMSVARFRFDVDEADPELLEAAVAQAAAGDIRLAQALANRNEPGIEAEFDLLRSGVSAASGAGIDIFGLSFFKQTIEAEGTVVVQTPGGARSLMFDTLQEESGLFVSRHGYTRVGLAGLVFDTQGRVVQSETNLIMQITESDKAMERDKLVDHLDALIIAMAGSQAYAVIDGPANELEVAAQALCPGAKISDPCTWESTADPDLAAGREAALASFEGALDHVSDSTAALLMTVAEHKLLAQSTYEVKHNGFIGPGTDLLVDFRLDDATLAQLARRDGSELVDALADILEATDTRRDRARADLVGDRAEIRVEAIDELAPLAAHYDAFTSDYRALLSAEAATIETIGSIGGRALEVRFGVDAQERPKYEDATVRSLSAARAAAVTDLVDAMIEDADEFDPHEEQLVAYGLLALSSDEHAEVRVDLDHFVEDTFATTRKVYRHAGYPEHLEGFARGPSTQAIDGGLFDVDALIDLD